MKWVSLCYYKPCYHPISLPYFLNKKQAAENAGKFSASLSKGFLVGGASAGGNFAAAVSLLARDDPFFKDKPLTGQLLLIPQVVHVDANVEK